MSIALRQIEVNLEKLTVTINEIRHGWKYHINKYQINVLSELIDHKTNDFRAKFSVKMRKSLDTLKWYMKKERT